MARHKHCHGTGVSIAVLLLLAAGCARREAKFRLPGSGLTMKLPAGWSQGEPRSSGGFMETSRGNYFFKNAANDDPSGNVFEYDRGGVTLAQYVDSMLKGSADITKGMKSAAEAVDKLTAEGKSGEMKKAVEALEGTAPSRTDRNINGREGIEIVTHGADVSIIELYMAHDGKIVCAVFRAPRNDFARCEPLFRAAIDSIEVK